MFRRINLPDFVTYLRTVEFSRGRGDSKFTGDSVITNSCFCIVYIGRDCLTGRDCSTQRLIKKWNTSANLHKVRVLYLSFDGDESDAQIASRNMLGRAYHLAPDRPEIKQAQVVLNRHRMPYVLIINNLGVCVYHSQRLREIPAAVTQTLWLQQTEHVRHGGGDGHWFGRHCSIL